MEMSPQERDRLRNFSRINLGQATQLQDYALNQVWVKSLAAFAGLKL